MTEHPAPLDPPVLGTLVDYHHGTVAVLRTKGSISEWITSSEHVALKNAR